MAGTGQGGLMFAVCDTEASQAQVLAALAKLAPQAWTTAFQ